MSDIASNIMALKLELPPSVRLVAVSKSKSVNDILSAYNSGQKSFGENRVQELLQKKDSLPSDIDWHLIGHLQSNKVKYVVPFINMIESVDSFRLLKVIDYEALKINRVIDCLLQVYIADEESKFGFLPNEITEMLESDEFRLLKSVRICGIMGIATFTENNDQVRREFRSLSDFFIKLKTNYFFDNKFFKEISMGMSGDYKLALMEGTTMVRIGSLIFGERNKK